MITPEARKRLAELMEQRLVDLRLTWREVAETGGISYEALRAARNGKGNIRKNTQAGIEDGLRWERGSIEMILDDGEPVPLAFELSRPAYADRPEIDFAEDAEREALEPYITDLLQRAREVLQSLYGDDDLPSPSDPGARRLLLSAPGRMMFVGTDQRSQRYAHVWDNEELTPGERLTILAQLHMYRDRASQGHQRRTGLTADRFTPSGIPGARAVAGVPS